LLLFRSMRAFSVAAIAPFGVRACSLRLGEIRVNRTVAATTIPGFFFQPVRSSSRGECRLWRSRLRRAAGAGTSATSLMYRQRIRRVRPCGCSVCGHPTSVPGRSQRPCVYRSQAGLMFFCSAADTACSCHRHRPSVVPPLRQKRDERLALLSSTTIRPRPRDRDEIVRFIFFDATDWSANRHPDAVAAASQARPPENPVDVAGFVRTSASLPHTASTGTTVVCPRSTSRAVARPK